MPRGHYPRKPRKNRKPRGPNKPKPHPHLTPTVAIQATLKIDYPEDQPCPKDGSVDGGDTYDYEVGKLFVNGTGPHAQLAANCGCNDAYVCQISDLPVVIRWLEEIYSAHKQNS